MRPLLAILAGAVFVGLCWILSGSLYGDPRILAGPVLLLRTQGTEDHVIGATLILILLPSMYVVTVWRNAATIALSALSCLGWIAVGFWIEAMASC
jgi:hypothetical protein